MGRDRRSDGGSSHGNEEELLTIWLGIPVPSAACVGEKEKSFFSKAIGVIHPNVRWNVAAIVVAQDLGRLAGVGPRNTQCS